MKAEAKAGMLDYKLDYGSWYDPNGCSLNIVCHSVGLDMDELPIVSKFALLYKPRVKFEEKNTQMVNKVTGIYIYLRNQLYQDLQFFVIFSQNFEGCIRSDFRLFSAIFGWKCEPVLD